MVMETQNSRHFENRCPYSPTKAELEYALERHQNGKFEDVTRDGYGTCCLCSLHGRYNKYDAT